jgi:hypothetical protein
MNMRRTDFKNAERADLKDFIKLAGLLMAYPGEADQKAKEFGFSDRVLGVLKAAVPGGLTSNVGLTDYGPLVGSFMGSLRHVGAFDRILADAFRLPLRPARVSVHSSAIVASEVAEGAGKPVRRLQFALGEFAPKKVIAQVVLSRELIEGLTEAGLSALGRELRASVVLGTDASFLSEIGATNSFEGSATNSFSEMLDALEELAHNVQLGATSKPYFVMTTQNAKGLAKAATANGITSVGVMGGEILGVPILVNDGQGAGKITLVDASGLAMATDVIDLRSSEHAALQLDDTPTNASGPSPTATSLVSMFATNNACLLAERYIAVKAVSPNATATLTNAFWGAVGDSPVGF